MSAIWPSDETCSFVSRAWTVFGSTRFRTLFQTINSASNRLQHQQYFLFDGGIADQSWLINSTVLPQDIAVESRTYRFFHSKDALIELIVGIRPR